MIERAAATAVTAFARFITGARATWQGCGPDPSQRIYFANHASHADFVLVWSALPPRLRRTTRPVAGADYWADGRLRRFCGERVFRAVLIDRDPATRTADPVETMRAALGEGSSLIVFPEGTRNTTEAPLLPFRSGLFHLARACPQLDLVPVWVANLNRVMPKGEVIPIPLLCTVTFGAPLRFAPGEDKTAFLDRARDALLRLAPAHAH
jgi:1-acyl-sn-glycerol-3-phosphate acyltransferase